MSKDFLDDIRNDHHQFDKGELKDHVGNSPFDLLLSWLEEAKDKKVNEPNAMALSTVGEDGFPTSRFLYLKEILNEKLIFYTNYSSRKGKDLASNPKCNLLFFWPELERQISIHGIAIKVNESVSDKYFASRPKSSQLGAWVSNQSEFLANREELENRLIAFSEKFPNEVPRPPHWGGFEVAIEKIEFWQGRPSRLHDRIVFERNENTWNIFRKNP